MTITTKIVRVESAEVAYEDVVIAEAADTGNEDLSLSNLDYSQLKYEALERSIQQTVIDLQQAFQWSSSSPRLLFAPMRRFLLMDDRREKPVNKTKK